MLLLEAGFLAVLVAPLGLLRCGSSHRNHDSVTFWLTRWLFFRLTFCTGASKLATGDPAWYGLSGILNHFSHYSFILYWLRSVHLCSSCRPHLFTRKSYVTLLEINSPNDLCYIKTAIGLWFWKSSDLNTWKIKRFNSYLNLHEVMVKIAKNCEADSTSVWDKLTHL